MQDKAWHCVALRPSLQQPAKLRRCDAHEPAEHIGQVALIGEAGVLADLAETHLRVAEQLFRALQTPLQNVLMGATPRAPLEELGEMERTQPSGIGQLAEMEIAVEVGVNIVQHTVEP